MPSDRPQLGSIDNTFIAAYLTHESNSDEQKLSVCENEVKLHLHTKLKIQNGNGRVRKCEIEASTISIIRFRGHCKGSGDRENALKHTHTYTLTHKYTLTHTRTGV